MILLGIIVTFQDENVLCLYQGQSLYTGLKQNDPGPSHDLDWTSTNLWTVCPSLTSVGAVRSNVPTPVENITVRQTEDHKPIRPSRSPVAIRQLTIVYLISPTSGVIPKRVNNVLSRLATVKNASGNELTASSRFSLVVLRHVWVHKSGCGDDNDWRPSAPCGDSGGLELHTRDPNGHQSQK